LDIERRRDRAVDQGRDIEGPPGLQRTEWRANAPCAKPKRAAQITARQASKKPVSANDQAIAEARIGLERETRQKEIERTQAVEARETWTRGNRERRASQPGSVDIAASPPEREMRQKESSAPARSRKPRFRRANSLKKPAFSRTAS